MDADAIAAKCRAGYGKAAGMLGRYTEVYRPTGATAAICATNYLMPTLAAFDTAPAFTFVNPTKFANRTFYALTDATYLAPGDYMVCNGITYFVATVDDIPAPMVIRCDRVMTVTRPGAQTPGPGYYGGDLTATETAVLTQWPASMAPGTKGGDGDVRLPGDTRLPWIKLMFPVNSPQIRFADVMTDDLPEVSRYIVSEVIYSPLGVEVTASQVLV